MAGQLEILSHKHITPQSAHPTFSAITRHGIPDSFCGRETHPYPVFSIRQNL